MDYYEILGLDKSASIEDIKRAYKKLALKYHPDKNGGDSDMFRKINEAYQFLGDPEKKRVYDEIHNGNDKDYSELLSMLMNIIINMMKKRWTSTSEKTKTQQQNKYLHHLNINIEISLDELYLGGIKKLVIKTKKLDGSLISKNIFIPLVDYKEVYIFEGQGDEIEKDKYNNIIIHLNIKNHDTINIDNVLDKYDLIILDTISLYEYYYGIKRQIKYLGGENINIDVSKENIVRYGNSVHVCLENKGLLYTSEDDIVKRGKLYIYYNIVLPLDIPEDCLSTLESHFNIRNNKNE